MISFRFVVIIEFIIYNHEASFCSYYVIVGLYITIYLFGKDVFFILPQCDKYSKLVYN